jgi:hypothetical protein
LASQILTADQLFDLHEAPQLVLKNLRAQSSNNWLATGNFGHVVQKISVTLTI